MDELTLDIVPQDTVELKTVPLGLGKHVTIIITLHPDGQLRITTDAPIDSSVPSELAELSQTLIDIGNIIEDNADLIMAGVVAE